MGEVRWHFLLLSASGEFCWVELPTVGAVPASRRDPGPDTRIRKRPWVIITAFDTTDGDGGGFGAIWCHSKIPPAPPHDRIGNVSVNVARI